MTVITLARIKLLSSFYNVQPHVFAALPSTYTLASFWTDTFGVDEPDISSTIDITQVVQDSVVNYAEMATLNDTLAQPASFSFDSATQTLYIHATLSARPLLNLYSEGHSIGYCEKKGVYVDDIWFAPLLNSVPNIEQSQDIANYDKLSFCSGVVTLNNLGGELDSLLTETKFGDELTVYALDDAQNLDNYGIDDLVPIAGFYVEDYTVSQKKATLNVQDRRKAGDVSIPTALFDAATYPNLEDDYVSQVIPLAYGLIAASTPVRTNGKLTTGAVTFRQALILTALGTVQVKIADVWTTKTPTVVDLATGSFTLATADARNGADYYECRVLGSTGIATTHASQAIVDLNLRYLGVAYLESNYDLVEWAEAEAALSAIGVLFDKEIKLYEAIRQIQAGANVGFRYEIKADGRRALRIDDWTRATSYTVRAEDLVDGSDLPVTTQFPLLAARVRIKYAHNYVEDEYKTAVSETYYEYVKESYRQMPTLDVETLLPTKTLADARAAADAAKYKDLIRTLECSVIGKDVATGTPCTALRIFDTIIVEATRGFVDLDAVTVAGDRTWLGVWKAQVLSVRPDTRMTRNTIRVALIEKIA